MWNFLKKRRALRSYRTTLATKLRKRYGRERFYTPEQVKTTAGDSGVSMAYVCFAFAMFCERDAFDAYHREIGESCDYVAMRSEAGAPTVESSDNVFTDVADLGDIGSDAGDGGDTADAGGGCGGDGGGCGGGCGGGGD